MPFESEARVALAYRKPMKAPPYERALRGAGLEPLALTPGSGKSLEGAAGLVLTGGTDVDPSLYGQSPVPECDMPDRERDDYEVAVLRDALGRGLPVLAICRGMQLMNVARGGTLIQHLATAPRHEGSHSAALSGNFVELFGAPTIAVNSRHHQAVDRVGEGLVVTARDPEDGTIEGVSATGGAWVTGVQWHPEDLQEDPVQRRLFARFAEAVQQHLAR